MRKTNKSLHLPYLLIILSLAIVILMLVTIKSSGPYSPKPTSKKVQLTKTPLTPEPTPVSPTATIPGEIVAFKPRHFKLNDTIVGTEKYPLEITQVPESSLLPTYCTRPYYKIYADSSHYYTYDVENYQGEILLTDKNIEKYIRILSSAYPNQTVIHILACSTENGKTVVLYSLGHLSSEDGGSKPYVGIVSGDDISVVGEIHQEADSITPYFGCRKPLQLTSDNLFYFECAAGDAGGFKAIYRVSLDTLVISKVQKCTITLDGSEDNIDYKCE